MKSTLIMIYQLADRHEIKRAGQWFHSFQQIPLLVKYVVNYNEYWISPSFLECFLQCCPFTVEARIKTKKPKAWETFQTNLANQVLEMSCTVPLATIISRWTNKQHIMVWHGFSWFFIRRAPLRELIQYYYNRDKT